MRHFKKTYQQTIALILLSIVLFSSMSFTIDKHYCDGELQNLSVLGKAAPCQKANSTKEVYCPVHKKIMIMDEEKSCCENKTVFVDADNDLKDANFTVPTIQQLQQFVIAYILILHTEVIVDKQSIQKFSYQSPIISRDIYVLSETFLL